MIDTIKGAGLNLDISRIPKSLRKLVPLVEKWGFEDPEDQDSFVEIIKKTLPSEIDAFNAAIDSAREEILRWGNELTQLDKQVDQLTEDDLNHPYWAYLAALKLRETTENRDANLAAKERLSAELRTRKYHEVEARAAELFRQKEYTEFVRILEPYIDLLSTSQLKRLEIARARR